METKTLGLLTLALEAAMLVNTLVVDQPIVQTVPMVIIKMEMLTQAVNSVQMVM